MGYAPKTMCRVGDWGEGGLLQRSGDVGGGGVKCGGGVVKFVCARVVRAL